MLKAPFGGNKSELHKNADRDHGPQKKDLRIFLLTFISQYVILHYDSRRNSSRKFTISVSRPKECPGFSYAGVLSTVYSETRKGLFFHGCNDGRLKRFT